MMTSLMMSNSHPKFILQPTAVTFGVVVVRAGILAELFCDKVYTIDGDPVPFIVMEQCRVQYDQRGFI